MIPNLELFIGPDFRVDFQNTWRFMQLDLAMDAQTDTVSIAYL